MSQAVDLRCASEWIVRCASDVQVLVLRGPHGLYGRLDDV